MSQDFARPKSYFEEIRKLASYVAARYREMSALLDDELCNDFQLPNEDAARKFLSDIADSEKAMAKL